METLTFYIGRANTANIALMRQGVDDAAPVPVEDNVVTRAVLKFGPHCLDTDDAEDFFQLTEEETVLAVQGGLIPDLVRNDYSGYLTVFDALSLVGISWEKFKIRALDWPICPEEPEEPGE